MVVVLNNGGGGIFRSLPVAKYDGRSRSDGVYTDGVFSPYFDTPHAHRLADACR